MKILWTIFEIFINIFQGFIFCFFTYKYLNSQSQSSFLKSDGVYYSLGLATLITFFNHITIFEHFWILLYVGLVYLYALKKLKGSFIEKMFASILPIIIMIITSSFIMNFTSALFSIPLTQIMSEICLQRFLAIISSQLMIIYLLFLSLKILKKNGENNSLNTKEWFLILSVFIISIIVSALLNFISMESQSVEERLLIIAIFLGTLIINFIVVYIVVDLSKMNNLKYENELLKIKEEYSRQYISDSNTEHDVIRKLRHDFKDNWSVVYRLISENKNEKALSFLEEFINELHQNETIIKTKNEIVNAVVNVKLSAAKSYGISVICMCVAEFKGISDFDLCSLLSNLLENALSACKESTKEGKRIYMNISADDYCYYFCIKNTIQSSVINSNPKLITTKNNTNEHGIGLKIINGIVNKYNGSFDFYEENDEFCCNITLKKDT